MGGAEAPGRPSQVSQAAQRFDLVGRQLLRDGVAGAGRGGEGAAPREPLFETARQPVSDQGFSRREVVLLAGVIQDVVEPGRLLR